MLNKAATQALHDIAFNAARVRLANLGVYHRFGECYWRDMLRNGCVLVTRDNPGHSPAYTAFEPHTKVSDALHFMGIFFK